MTYPCKPELEDAVWDVVGALYDGEETATEWRYQAIERFLERLPIEEVLDAARIARRRFPYTRMNRFKYFCGVCWRKARVFAWEPVE